MYAAMARHWLRGNDTLLIVLDWSDLNESRSAQMIRASVALNGRSLTLYEQGHSMKAATKPEVHKAFLARLKMMLAPGCQPIVMTDAGFRSPWFRAVEAHGWRGVGWDATETAIWCAATAKLLRSGAAAGGLGLAGAFERSGHRCDLRTAHADRAGLSRHQECALRFGAPQ